MGTWFWIKRFVTAFIVAFLILALVQAAKGYEWDEAITHGLIWGFISSVIFTAARIYQSSRGNHCALCKDTPEMQDPSPPGGTI